MDRDKNKYLCCVKIFYKNGKHIYANVFKREYFDSGIKLGTIMGYRKMNMIERFIFRSCL